MSISLENDTTVLTAAMLKQILVNYNSSEVVIRTRNGDFHILMNELDVSEDNDDLILDLSKLV